MKVAVFSFERMDHACAYIRLISPLDACRTSITYAWGVNFQHTRFFKRRRLFTKYLDFSDLVIVQRTFPQKRTISALNKILSSGNPVIYDTDDLLFDLPDNHILRPAFEKYKPYMLDFMRSVDAITVSTPALAETVRPFNRNVHVLPNLIDDSLWNTIPTKQYEKIVIGFSGSSTHAGDIAMIEDALLRIVQKYGSQIIFKFLGSVSERLSKLPCVEFLDFQPSYCDYALSLMGAGIDIAIVPLEDTPFNRCKSNIKWLEYSACGIPGVYSDVLPYNSCVTNGHTGLLAGSTTEEWFASLETLITNKVLRHAIGAMAQKRVLAEYSLSKKAYLYSDLYKEILQRNNSVKPDGLFKFIRKLCNRSPFKR